MNSSNDLEQTASALANILKNTMAEIAQKQVENTEREAENDKREAENDKREAETNQRYKEMSAKEVVLAVKNVQFLRESKASVTSYPPLH